MKLCNPNRVLCILLCVCICSACVSLCASGASVVAQSPRIVDTVYPTRDIVVADIVLTDPPYNADSTGKTDCAAVLQRAIDDCFASGGGTVFLPVGRYRLCSGITIRPFVTVRGDWQDPDTGTDYGTVIVADVESRDTFNPALFTVGGSAGAVGLTVWYPNQTLDHVLPYPYTFYIDGHGANYMLQTVENCTLLNAYRGVGAGQEWKNGTAQVHEMLTISCLKGTCLAEGLANCNSADVDTGKTIYFSPRYWANAGEAYHAPVPEDLQAYTQTHLTAFLFGDLEWPEYCDLRADHCHYGICLEKGARAAFSGTFFDLYLTDCRYGIYAEDGAVMYRGKRWGYSVCNGVIEGENAAVTNEDKTLAQLTNVQIRGNVRGKNIHRETASTDAFSLDYARTYKKPAANLYVIRADGTGMTDASAAVQTALDAAGKTGGVAYLPAGIYRFSHPVTVPAGVELRGSGCVPTRCQSGCSKGTLILADCGYAPDDVTATALITLDGDGAGLYAVRVLFARNCPRDDSGRYLQTFPAVYAQGTDIHIIHCGAALAGEGFVCKNCDRVYIRSAVGCCINGLFRAEDCSDLCIEDCLQNGNVLPRNGYAQTDIPELQNWIREENIFEHFFIPISRKTTNYITLRRCSDAVIFNTFIYGGRQFLCAQDSSAFVCGVGSDGSAKGVPTFSLSGSAVTVIGSMRSTSDGRCTTFAYEADSRTKLRMYDRQAVDLPYHEYTRFANIRLTDLKKADWKTYFLQPVYAVYEWFGRTITDRKQA